MFVFIIMTVGMKTCANDGECNTLKHSRCSSGKCACATNAVAEDDVCKRKFLFPGAKRIGIP